MVEGVDEATLARWQARLLALLREGATPAAIREALAGDPALAGARPHTEALDAHALELARQLVAKWRPA